MFTQGTHHNNWSIIYITQNMYAQGKHARTITLNCTYMVIFKSWRDTNQIKTMSQQTGLGKKLTSAFADATAIPYGYLVIDFAAGVDDKYRLRSKVFPEEDMWVYI
jgi:hypothetical protein